jgi:stage II sporulation protein D
VIARHIVVLATASIVFGFAAASVQGAAPACATGCKVAPAGSGPLFVLSGHGWGHGVGMSQYGAFGYAQHGWTYDRIVAHYFPGTTLGNAPVSRIRVLLAQGKRELKLSSSADFTVRDGAGVVHQLPAGTYTLGPTLALTIGTAAPVTLAPPLTFDPGGAPVALGRPYRGSIEIDVVNGKLRAINTLPLEQYLYGVVPSEMPFDWASEALKAQAVVARSYALATRKAAAPFDVYSDVRSQVYLGLSHETPETNAAVDATKGQVAMFNGTVASTFFFSSSGGRTANAADVWSGGGAFPYLVSVPDPYDTISPYHDWGPVLVTAKQLAKAFHLSGTVTDARPALDRSGRVATLALSGPLNELDVAGTKVRTALKLRSTWFGVGVLSLSRPAPVAPIEYGASAPLSGVVRGLAQVELEQRPAGATWQSAGPVTPAPDGSVALTAAPTVTTDFRLATASVAAAPVRVAVTPRVRFSDDQTVGLLRGSIQPLLPGAPVEIQRQDEATGTWTPVATTTVDAAGNFAGSVFDAGTYRARVGPTGGYAAGLSPVLQVATG